jgi:hypothetical protein
VIPEEWRPVRRPEDGELVGYLAPAGDDGLAVPTSLLGLAVDGMRTAGDAEPLLVSDGLRAVDGWWWCRLPSPLPGGVLAAADPIAAWSWRPVVVVEISPVGCRVRPEWPAPDEATAQARLPVPVGELLRRQPPE